MSFFRKSSKSIKDIIKVRKMKSCCLGNVMNITQLEDEILSSGILGEGYAVKLTGDNIVSPVDGIILDVTTSGCGLLIKTDDGLKILIHLSKDTKTLPSVDMHTKAGDSVCVGQLLCNFIKPHSDDIVCVIITNSDELKSFAVHPGVCDSADYCAAEYSI